VWFGCAFGFSLHSNPSTKLPSIVIDNLMRGLALRPMFVHGTLSLATHTNCPDMMMLSCVQNHVHYSYLLKPIRRDGKGFEEINVLDALERSEATASPLDQLRSIIPKFHGIAQIGSFLFLILDDVTSGLQHPCTMNICLGFPRLGTDSRSDIHDAPLQLALGFRVSSVMVQTKNGSPMHLGSQFGSSLTPSDVGLAFARFFTPGNGSFNDEALMSVIALLEGILPRLEDAEQAHALNEVAMVIAYERDSSKADVRALEFDCLAQGLDSARESQSKNRNGVSTGLRSLITSLQELAAR
jgi:hypothetical protein